MENTNIKVRAHQQMKAAIMQFDNIPGCKTIVLQGYAEEERLTIGANFPIDLAKGQIKLSAWMMMDVRSEKCAEDWCMSVDTAKLAKRMPKIEGDKEAFINFEYAPKPTGTGASIIFNDRGTAGKKHDLLPQMPLSGVVDFLPITFDDVEGAIHFYKNTGGSEGINIHIYVKMHDYGSVLEARAIISNFGIKLEPNAGGATFSIKASKPETSTTTKNKTNKKKEDTMPDTTEKTTELPAPPAATSLPTLPPPPEAGSATKTETPAAKGEPDNVETPPTTDAATESTTEDAGVETPKKPKSNRSKEALLEKAIARVKEAGYDVVAFQTTDDLDTDPTIANKLDEINEASLTIARLSGEINDEINAGDCLAPGVADQIRELLSK